MFENIISPLGFCGVIAFFAVGAVGSLFSRDRLATLWSTTFAIMGSLTGLVFSLALIAGGVPLSFSLPSPHLFFSVSIAVDLLKKV